MAAVGCATATRRMRWVGVVDARGGCGGRCLPSDVRGRGESTSASAGTRLGRPVWAAVASPAMTKRNRAHAAGCKWPASPRPDVAQNSTLQPSFLEHNSTAIPQLTTASTVTWSRDRLFVVVPRERCLDHATVSLPITSLHSPTTALALPRAFSAHRRPGPRTSHALS